MNPIGLYSRMIATWWDTAGRIKKKVSPCWKECGTGERLKVQNLGHPSPPPPVPLSVDRHKLSAASTSTYLLHALCHNVYEFDSAYEERNNLPIKSSFLWVSFLKVSLRSNRTVNKDTPISPFNIWIERIEKQHWIDIFI